MTAKRYNEGKIDFTVLPVDGLEEVTKVLQHARDNKYPDNADGTANWEKLWGKNTVKLLLACALRHTFAIMRGEIYDKESGFMHAGHVIANMFMLVRYFNEQKEVDLKEEVEEINVGDQIVVSTTYYNVLEGTIGTVLNIAGSTIGIGIESESIIRWIPKEYLSKTSKLSTVITLGNSGD